jgi:hypothetical protein
MVEIDKQVKRKAEGNREGFGYCFRIQPNEIDREICIDKIDLLTSSRTI